MAILNTRKAIINAVVTLLTAQVEDFKSVSDKPLSRVIPDNKFPACRIARGLTNYESFISKTRKGTMQIRCRIYAKASTSDDVMDDLVDAVIDGIDTDNTLGGTCIVCDVIFTGEPDLDEANNSKYCEVILTAEYWRER